MSINNVYTNKGKYIVYKSKYCMYSNDTFIKSGGTVMENSNVKENLEVLFEKFKNMIKVETVVGEAVQITILLTKTMNVVAVAAVPKWNQALSSLLKANASSCSTLKATLTAAASIVLSVWYLTSCLN